MIAAFRGVGWNDILFITGCPEMRDYPLYFLSMSCTRIEDMWFIRSVLRCSVRAIVVSRFRPRVGSTITRCESAMRNCENAMQGGDINIVLSHRTFAILHRVIVVSTYGMVLSHRVFVISHRVIIFSTLGWNRETTLALTEHRTVYMRTDIWETAIMKTTFTRRVIILVH